MTAVLRPPPALRLLMAGQLPAALIAVLILWGCTSDIDLAWMVPGEIDIKQEHVFVDRDFGVCAIEVFALEEPLASSILEGGLSTLANARQSRGGKGGVCKKSGSECQLQYVPWMSGPLDSMSTPDLSGRAASEAVGCLGKYPELKAKFAAALDDGGAYFTYAVSATRNANDQVLVIFPELKVLVAIPH
jgi:hypothetical protein